MDLDAVADELYGLRPEDFTAARDERAAAARDEGDRALAEKIGKLRRPSLSAWAGNLLVREQPEQVEPLLRLGEGLRQAHRELNGEQLRELSRRQRTLINALTRQVRRLAAEAGHPISEGVLHEVEDTLHAVLADPEAARQWASGRLVKPLSPSTGFPAAQVEAPAPAAPPAPARGETKADAERRRRLTQARQEAEEAEQELRVLEDEATAAGRAADDAKELVSRLQQRIDELTQALQNAEDEQREARTAEQEARERVRSTDRRVREARRRARTAAARAERLAAQDRGS